MLNDSNMRGVLLVFAAVHLALGAYQAIDPSGFFDGLGGFGTENEHYIRDTAAFPLALGIAGLLAATRISWRVPVLATATFWYLLHAANHAFDVNESNEDWVGWFDVGALAVGGLLLAWLARQAAALERGRRLR